jgi:hypothetical protein
MIVKHKYRIVLLILFFSLHAVTDFFEIKNIIIKKATNHIGLIAFGLTENCCLLPKALPGASGDADFINIDFYSRRGNTL